MIKEFEEAAFGAAPGQIVGPVETSFGLHLIETLGAPARRRTPPVRRGRGRDPRQARRRARRSAGGEPRRTSSRRGSPPRSRSRRERPGRRSPTTTTVTLPHHAGVRRSDEPCPGSAAARRSPPPPSRSSRARRSAPVEVPRGWAILRLREEKAGARPDAGRGRGQGARRRRSAPRRAGSPRRSSPARAAQLAAGKTLDEVAKELGARGRRTRGEFTRDRLDRGPRRRAPVAERGSGREPGDARRTGLGPRRRARCCSGHEPQRFDAAAFAAGARETREELRARRSQSGCSRRC